VACFPWAITIPLPQGRGHLRGENAMKNKLKFSLKEEPVQTGLRVRTLVSCSASYSCGCYKLSDGGYQCVFDGNDRVEAKVSGNEVMGWLKLNCSERAEYGPYPEP